MRAARHKIFSGRAETTDPIKAIHDLGSRVRSRKGIDPRGDDPTKSDNYKSEVDDYVDRYQIGECHNVKAEEARRTLLNACADWHARPLATIRPLESNACWKRCATATPSVISRRAPT
jgi:hypothetical protein